MSTSIKALGQDEKPSVSHKEVLEYDEDSKQDQSSALEGSAEPAHIEWTEEESRRVRFKMDICILPLSVEAGLRSVQAYSTLTQARKFQALFPHDLLGGHKIIYRRDSRGEADSNRHSADS
jgi:hypothetical protein